MIIDAWLTAQESEIDADSIRSRFRFLIPIMLGACHVMACVLWYVGTYNLPLSTGVCSASDVDSDGTSSDPICQDYKAKVASHWLSGYTGDPVDGVLIPFRTQGDCCRGVHAAVATLWLRCAMIDTLKGHGCRLPLSVGLSLHKLLLLKRLP